MPRQSCKIPKTLNLQVVKSKHGETYKVKIAGRIGRIAVHGETTPIYLHIDEINHSLAQKITRVFRADGSGRTVPFATRRKVIDAVFCKLTKLKD